MEKMECNFGRVKDMRSLIDVTENWRLRIESLRLIFFSAEVDIFLNIFEHRLENFAQNSENPEVSSIFLNFRSIICR